VRIYHCACLSAAWLIGIPQYTIAQECNLMLKLPVVETHNFHPVYPALAFIDELRKSFDADERGNIVVPNLCPGFYTVHVQAAGYQPFTTNVNLIQSTQTMVKLSHLQSELQTVNVHDQAVHTILQDKDELKRSDVLANSGKTIAEVLGKVNGVSVLTNGGTIAKPVIHGLHSNRIVMLNNGVRQEDQQWGGEHAPNIDPFLANNITVIKGAASVRYGTDAIGGVVLVEPKPLLHTPGWEAELNTAAFSNNRMGALNGMAGYRFKNIPLSFRLQGTLKKSGNYRIPGYWVANTGVEEVNYSAAAAYRRAHTGAEVFYSHFNTVLGIYRGSHTGSRQDLLNAIASPKPTVPADFTYAIDRPYQHVMHDMVKAKLYADTRIGMWNLLYAYQHNYRQEYDVQRVKTDRAQLNLTLNTQTFNLNLDHHRFLGLTGQAGVDGIFQENYFKPGDRLFIPNYRSFGGGAYLIEKYPIGPFVAEGGLRYDQRWYEVFNPEGANQQVVRYTYNYNNVSGTFGLRHQVRHDLDWSLTLSNAWRAPQANELFSAGVHHGAARLELGNKDLKPERSCNLNLSAKHKLRNKLTTEVSLYSQLISDYIFLEPGEDVLTIRGYFKTFRYKQTDAQLTGADITVGYDWNARLNTTFKGSFLRAWNKNAQTWLILMPADRLTGRISYAVPWRAKQNTLDLGLSGRYVFQQQRVPGNFDAIDYPRPPSGFFVADVSVGTTVAIRKQPVDISLTATNLLNEKYRDYLDAFRYFIDQPGRDLVLRIHIPFASKPKPTNDILIVPINKN
jgi:iron complex outermembrane receptor protein